MTVGGAPITTLLVDLDDTLYESREMCEQVADNIRTYMVEKLGVQTSECEELCRELYLNYGTTLAGLVVSYLMREQRSHNGEKREGSDVY